MGVVRRALRYEAEEGRWTRFATAWVQAFAARLNVGEMGVSWRVASVVLAIPGGGDYHWAVFSAEAFWGRTLP